MAATRSNPSEELDYKAADLYGERALLARIVERAVLDARGYTSMIGNQKNDKESKRRARMQARLDAMDWIFSDSESDFSFLFCMRYLDQSGNSVRMYRQALRRELGEFYDYWRKVREGGECGSEQ